MENAVHQLAEGDWGIKLKEDKDEDTAKDKSNYSDLKNMKTVSVMSWQTVFPELFIKYS
ncbi:MAG: hypothetical protein WKG06_02425 [Segetibacter sp.]